MLALELVVVDCLAVRYRTRPPTLTITYSRYFRYICVNRTIATGREGLLILLRQMVYPNRLYELSQEFGRHESMLSLIFNTVLDDLYQRFDCKLTDLNQARWYNLERFSNACTRKGSPLSNCWGSIDGNCMAVCRPSTGQRACYSWHKREHCMKFQGVMTLCGLIAHLFGPIEVSRHDSYMLGESKLLDYLSEGVRATYCLHGDPAYPLQANLITPYRGEVNEDQHEFKVIGTQGMDYNQTYIFNTVCC